MPCLPPDLLGVRSMFDPEKQQRRSVRLPDHSYTEGGYFVTICTQNRACIFGEISGDSIQLSEAGKIACEEWAQTAVVRPYVQVDSFVVMPNHTHGSCLWTGHG